MKLCLAASGGGHIRQLLDLEPLWRERDYFFVTEDTPLGRSITADHPGEFVPHVALGQARLGHRAAMLKGAVRSVFASLRIVLRRRPDVVITTGAGSMFFVTLWARLFGARVIVIDSFARFERPSAFARLAGPMAHLRIAQAAQSGKIWGTPHVFDPFRRIEAARPAKEPLLFATVGATLAFPRLVELVADAHGRGLLPERVILQCGVGGRHPDGIEAHETLPFGQVQDILRRADYVVCHGGTGSLITALREGCRVIAIPRRFELGEHYDDHQTEITQVFRARGLIEIANTPEEFAAALDRLSRREPERATTDPQALIDFLVAWLDGRGRSRPDAVAGGQSASAS